MEINHDVLVAVADTRQNITSLLTPVAPDANSPSTIYFRASFVAANNEESVRLTDALFDATADIMCPPNDMPLVPCYNCEGSGVNLPFDDDEDPTAYPGDAAPGLPCITCGDTDHVGQIEGCVRTHSESSTGIPGEFGVDPEDRRTLLFTKTLLDAVLDHVNDPAAALAAVVGLIGQEVSELKDMYTPDSATNENSVAGADA